MMTPYRSHNCISIATFLDGLSDQQHISEEENINHHLYRGI